MPDCLGNSPPANPSFIRLLTTHYRLPNSAPTVCRHTVSGAVSLPSRGAFHLSLTVLVLYRSHGVFSLGRWSSRIPTGFLVPRGTWDTPARFRLFAYRAVTFCGRPFQTASAKSTRLLVESPATPPLLAGAVWARPSSLAATGGFDFSFSSSGY